MFKDALAMIFVRVRLAHTHRYISLHSPWSTTTCSLTFRCAIVAIGGVLDQTLLSWFPKVERLLPRQGSWFRESRADTVHVLDGFKVYLQAPMDPRNNRILYNPYKDDIAAQCIVNLGTSGFGRGRSLLTASSETESSVCRNDYRTWGRDLQNGDKTLTDKGFKIGDIMDHFNGKFDRPEDMTPGVGGKHVVDAGVAVANAQARGHSERLVGYYQSFKLLSQRKITRDEWPYLDYVLAFVSSVQIFSGPLVMH